jgi:hypothetical protein
MLIDGTNIFAGTGTHAGAPVTGIYLSTDNGSSWTDVNNGLPPVTATDVYALAIIGSNIFAGTYHGVYLSTNNGASWNLMNNGLPAFPTVTSLAVNGTVIYAGTYEGVYISTNNGSSWFPAVTGLPLNPLVTALVTSGANILVGIYASNGGVYLSTNNGNSWTAVNSGITDSTIRSFAVSGTNIFAGTNNGVFLSTNNGNSWISVNSGLPPNIMIASMAISGSVLYAGTIGNAVWKRPLSEMVTSTGEIVSYPVTEIYPNPFIYETVIKTGRSIKNATLTICNPLGKQLKQMRNISGTSITITRDNLPAGIYFMQLKENNKIIATERLLILD